MTTGRDAFLQRVRQAVVEGNRAGTVPALAPRGDTGYQGGGPDLVERFCRELAGAGGQAHPVVGPEAAACKVIELIQAKGARRILLGQGGLLDALGLEDRLRALNIEVVRTDTFPGKDLLFAAEIGVSGVHALIAETGTIVAAAAPDEPRSLSLLPPVHIAVAGRTHLLPDLFDLFASLAVTDDQTARLPSCLALITGPSKTGDIELRLVTGVHGPGEVHVVLITD